jgi:hypothetical protein
MRGLSSAAALPPSLQAAGSRPSAPAAIWLMGRALHRSTGMMRAMCLTPGHAGQVKHTACPA